MIQFVAFDLGGVLVDVQLGRLAESLECDAASVDTAFFGGGRHDAFSTGSLDATGYLGAAARSLNRVEADAHAAWSDVVAPYAAAGSVLSALTRPFVAWSNTDPVHIAALSPLFPPDLLGPKRCLSYEVGANKPDLAFFRAALGRIEWAPEEILYLDDKAENVASARSMGIVAHQVQGLAETVDTLHAMSAISPSFQLPAKSR